jgi:2-polyprenyl-3-methyl-5-hydroxy-6-metoxy-1,4-benzoquinol methylase
MRRRAPSAIARALHRGGFLTRLCVSSVLDFGCGWGQDVQFYRGLGLRAQGYDPAPAFEADRIPEGIYDLVTVVYVINVLPARTQREETLRAACRFVRPGGALVVASRSLTAIDRQATRGDWPIFSDGYLSHVQRCTFQRGHTQAELSEYLRGLSLAEVEPGLRINSTAVVAIGSSALLRIKR